MISSALLFAVPFAFQANAASIPASAQAIGLDISATLQNILANTQHSDAYTYPTDLTRGIVVKPIHSHNDYWRDVPFYSALSVGCASIEADVWLYNDTLYVGHETSALTPARTLDSLYIQPLLDTLKRQNPSSAFVTSPTKNGVYDTSSGQTLLLFIDLKTNGTTTWPAVVAALQPLRSAGYLTTFNGTGVTVGPVTVIGTGNTPLDQIAPVQQRDYFFDAQLHLLNSTQSNITAAISPVASTAFSAQIGAVNGTTFNSTQLATLRSQIALAKSKGILPRYWDTPGWPISTRNAVWGTLLQEGVGLLNADDLPAAAGFGAYYGLW
ncbi:Altered inheritance of mitochondria protein 6 [Cladophialophora carrionii]|uniref:Altered inheritance of mitochondria protein 6 n=1 Tax=Cladophialophora carrionii TaxID=86049 RepID=A0A1C1CVX6_9EURO|nr:Altered inheritance of mitochondria protein 6 [Cladophialophora carrionii]